MAAFTAAKNFYPRPPRGGRPEKDLCVCYTAKFLSTPSARRATNRGELLVVPPADFYPRPPRGGRRKRDAVQNRVRRFLSTPSARRATRKLHPEPGRRGISIHALREEGDRSSVAELSLVKAFLSTPSARRATAKTETKSLFSNKLYNILHEFRRALIYNGSKSYPNHAK